jgi:hypothetical protein
MGRRRLSRRRPIASVDLRARRVIGLMPRESGQAQLCAQPGRAGGWNPKIPYNPILHDADGFGIGYRHNRAAAEISGASPADRHASHGRLTLPVYEHDSRPSVFSSPSSLAASALERSLPAARRCLLAASSCSSPLLLGCAPAAQSWPSATCSLSCAARSPAVARSRAESGIAQR